ncbi:MAG: MBOAT family protein [Bacteroidales bacterium]
MEYLQHLLFYNPEQPFLFTSLSFWIFFTFVLGVFSLLYPYRQSRNGFLFAASLFFYYKTGGFFVFLLLISILFNYFWALQIEKQRKKTKRKIYLTLGVILNLSLLLYFKYNYFLIDLCNTIFNTHWQVVDYLSALSNVLVGSDFTLDEIILPVGISFFTFQALSYIVDVYRKKIKAVHNFIDFGFYLSFFPQLVAGPIVRASDFIPQLKQHYQLSSKEFSLGLFLIINGLIKKMFISDYISLQFVDRVFENPSLYTGFENWMAMYAYAIQIYCDFSGYTDIAIGIAAILGFKLPINFNSPYKAKSISDFWHRWHISLSSWLRDYLYIPLGGNRKGHSRTYLNLLITMLLGGLWHGANFKFLVWGGIHGGSLALEKLYQQTPLAHNAKYAKTMRIISIILTFHIVCFAWIFFRASSLEVGFEMFNLMFTHIGWEYIPSIVANYALPLAITALGFTFHWLPYRIKAWYRFGFYKLPILGKMSALLLVLLLIYQVQTSDLQAFIYFQF